MSLPLGKVPSVRDLSARIFKKKHYGRGLTHPQRGVAGAVSITAHEFPRQEARRKEKKLRPAEVRRNQKQPRFSLADSVTRITALRGCHEFIY
jgi:hypothetical protein